jgi:hypothetical protein
MGTNERTYLTDLAEALKNIFTEAKECGGTRGRWSSKGKEAGTKCRESDHTECVPVADVKQLHTTKKYDEFINGKQQELARNQDEETMGKTR